MHHADLKNLYELNEKIERALEESNFILLASLSKKLSSLVETMTSASAHRDDITENDIKSLEKQLLRINQYQIKTEAKFRDYTSKISKQTKMQNAYKDSRG